MSHYVVIKKIQVQNANAVAGLTWGFPAVTHFLGFAHALSRKVPSDIGLSLGGVGIICHSHNIQARQPKGWGDYVFALTRNPLTKEGKTAPIIEEGRMNMEVSLVIELQGLVAGDEQRAHIFLEWFMAQLPKTRLAGGQIINQPTANIVPIHEANTAQQLRRLLPGFALVDRAHYLHEHFAMLKQDNEQASLLDAWLHFSALQFQAQAINNTEHNSEPSSSADQPQKATWHYKKKPAPGYLVPINIGYCAISEVYEPATIDNVRDSTIPAVFTEAAHSIGEWLSPHRIHNMDSFIWRYHHQHPWYIAKAQPLLLPALEDADVEHQQDTLDQMIEDDIN